MRSHKCGEVNETLANQSVTLCGWVHRRRDLGGLIVIDFPTVWARDADEYISKGLAVHDRYRGDPLVHTIFAPHAPYTVSDQPLEHIRTLADEMERLRHEGGPHGAAVYELR